MPGCVYLLHFDRPYHHAQHWLAATGRPLPDVLAALRAGLIPDGSGRRREGGLLAAVHRAGITLHLADVWETATEADAWQLLKQIKRQGHRGPAICSICSPGTTRGDVSSPRRKRQRERIA